MKKAGHIGSYYYCCYEPSANGRRIFQPLPLPPGAEALKERFDAEIKMRISLEPVTSSWTLLWY